MLLSVVGLSANTITSAVWHGADFIVSFSDSAIYHVDLEESDSAHVVLRILDASLAPGALQSAMALPGPNNRAGAVTITTDSARITITAQPPFGYSTEWMPYSHRLVIHTFNWSDIKYPEEQYHKGLLAFEQGFDAQAEELLSVAYQTGESRAGQALAWYYAMHGKDSLAMRLLSAPIAPDDFAALASIYRRRGDTAMASKHAASFVQKLHESESAGNNPTVTDKAQPNTAADSAIVPVTSGGPSIWRKFRASLGDWRVIAAIGFMGLALVLGVIAMFMRRSSNNARLRAEKRLAERRAQQPTVTRITRPAPDVAHTEVQHVSAPTVVEAPSTDSSHPSHSSHTSHVAPEPAPPSPPVAEVAEKVVPSQNTTAVTEQHVAALQNPRDTRLQSTETRHTLESVREEEQRAQTKRPEQTLDAARRQNVSRDQIELRKKLSALKNKPTDNDWV